MRRFADVLQPGAPAAHGRSATAWAAGAAVMADGGDRSPAARAGYSLRPPRAAGHAASAPARRWRLGGCLLFQETSTSACCSRRLLLLQATGLVLAEIDDVAPLPASPPHPPRAQEKAKPAAKKAAAAEPSPAAKDKKKKEGKAAEPAVEEEEDDDLRDKINEICSGADLSTLTLRMVKLPPPPPLSPRAWWRPRAW